MSLDGEWVQDNRQETIVVTVPINTAVFDAVNEDNQDTLIQIVVGKAAIEAEKAVKRRLGLDA